MRFEGSFLHKIKNIKPKCREKKKKALNWFNQIQRALNGASLEKHQYPIEKTGV